MTRTCSPCLARDGRQCFESEVPDDRAIARTLLRSGQCAAAPVPVRRRPSLSGPNLRCRQSHHPRALLCEGRDLAEHSVRCESHPRCRTCLAAARDPRCIQSVGTGCVLMQREQKLRQLPSFMSFPPINRASGPLLHRTSTLLHRSEPQLRIVLGPFDDPD